MPLWIGLGLLVALAFFVALFTSVVRERDFALPLPRLGDLETALPTLAGATGGALLDGNAVEVLQNGDEFFPALLRDVGAAERSVHLESYVWWRGDICREIAAALAARARAGVAVRVLLDALGSGRLDPELLRLMRGAGCRVARYHPLRLRDLALFNKRSHRKLAIVDGRVAHVFGHGLAREWLGRGQDPAHWRDTGVRLRGPAVGALQGVFAQHWVEETGEVLGGEESYPRLAAAGSSRVHVVAGSALGGPSPLELLFKLAIAAARRELLIQNPYFIADRQTVDLLRAAVGRGVRVAIMVPAVTDARIVRHAGHHRFGALLAAGVEIYEHRTTLIHQKVMVVDGLWSHVGSTNLDDRSFGINDEVAVGIVDGAVAAALAAAFAADLRSCVELEAAAWRRRRWRHKVADGVAYLLKEQL